MKAIAINLLLFVPALAAQEASDATKPAKAKTELAWSRPQGSYADLPEVGSSLTSLMGGVQGVRSFPEFVGDIEKFVANTEQKTLVLDLSANPSFNMPQWAELERTLRMVRAAGKNVIAYLENADLGDIQIASQCDRVLMAEMGMMDLRSLAMSVMFMKDAMDLLGVQMDVIRCGDFKGAVEPFMLSEMSAHLREHYRAMLEPMNADLVRRLASGRKLDPAKVRELQGQRLFTAKQALAAGLVDKLVPWSGASRACAAELAIEADALTLKSIGEKKKRGGGNPFTMFAELMNPKKRKPIEKDSLVVFHLSGAIEDGQKRKSGTIVSGPVVEAVAALQENPHVKGVVVRVNSPGGSATASESILLALQRLAAVKPVVVSMGDLAASGGYYVTCLGRPIFAEAGTITGSIGVFGMKPNAGALMRRVGLRTELIALDESAAMTALDKSWSDAGKARMQTFVDEIYDRFIGHVAASRKLSREAVLAIAGGRVWSGDQAVSNKLVDRIGGLGDALNRLIEETKVAGAEVVHWPEPQSVFEAFSDALGEIRVQSPLPAGLELLADRLGMRASVSLLLQSLREPMPRAFMLLPVDLHLR